MPKVLKPERLFTVHVKEVFFDDMYRTGECDIWARSAAHATYLFWKEGADHVATGNLRAIEIIAVLPAEEKK